jgi:hypothetical protein
MPSGHSSGFQIARKDLAGLLKSIAAHAVVGKLIDGAPILTPILASDALRLVESATGALPVEEQDDSFYVIHFTDTLPTIWVMVTAASPLFGALQACHYNNKRA